MRALALVWTLGVAAAACRSSSQPVAPPPLASAPAPRAPAAAPAGLTSAAIDAMLAAEWARAGITPAPAAGDATFLRRAYLDVVGTIPPPDVALAFAADPRPDKRARAVDALLDSPAYAEHWSRYWTDALLGHGLEPQIDREAFRGWLAARFAAGAPWDRVVLDLLTAEGVNSEGGPRYGPSRAGAADAAPTGEEVNGAVNLFVKYRDAPQDLAGTVSRVFLGVQIQCAQCHDHKTEKWTQADFRGVAACFTRTRVEPLDLDKAAMGRKRLRVVDIGRPLPRFAKNPELLPFTSAPPRALDGTELSRAPDARRALAAWTTSRENPWFARAIVNRMWGHFLGRGFVDPVDDLRPGNPTTAPEILTAVAADLRDGGFDLRRLVRLITSTQAYQLSSNARPGVSPAAQPELDKLWPRFRIEPLGPEELLNAILDATGLETTLRAAGNVDVDKIRDALSVAYAFLFDVDEETDQADFDGTLAQALALLNGKLVGGGASDVRGSALDQILARPDADGAKIDALYLRALGRAPGAEERDYFVRYVTSPPPVDADPRPPAPASSAPAGPLARLRALAEAKGGKRKGAPDLAGPVALGRLAQHELRVTDPRRRAYEDVFWALLNSSEFAFNH